MKKNLYIFFIVGYLLIGGVWHFYYPDFTNSNFYFASITFVVGSLAFYIYAKQKIDEKVNAAVSILFEIRNAEEKIEIIREKLNSSNKIDLPAVLPVNSWIKYSHLFAKDFDEDELKLLNIFYNCCSNVEDLINRQNNFIWVAAEERAKTAQKLLGEIHVEFQRDISNGVTSTDAGTKFKNQKEGITKFYGDEDYFYAAQKPIAGLGFEVARFQKITTTTCGAKLKNLANS